jgi:hypothetical protein
VGFNEGHGGEKKDSMVVMVAETEDSAAVLKGGGDRTSMTAEVTGRRVIVGGSERRQ